MPRAPRRCGRQVGSVKCDELVPCPTHRRTDAPGRPRRQERGHGGPAYDKADRDPEFTAATHCPTCGDEFGPKRPKTKGHIDKPAREGGTKVVAQCGRCNFGWKRSPKAR